MTKEDDARVAAVLGWPAHALNRTKAGIVVASWFPMNRKQAVLMSGSCATNIVPPMTAMSLALEEQYKAMGGVPQDLGAFAVNPYATGRKSK